MRFLKNVISWIEIIIPELPRIAGVIYIVYMFNVVIECVIIYIAMNLTRNIFGKGYHAHNNWFLCTAITLGVFYFLCAGVKPLHISYFTAPFFGVAVSFIMSHVNKYVEFLNKNKFKIEKGCDEGKLVEYLKLREVPDKDIKLFVRKYINDDSDVKLMRDFNSTNIRRDIRDIKYKYNLN